MMFRSSISSIVFVLLILAGIGFVCSDNTQDNVQARGACTVQGESCIPSRTRCCGRMGCYDYDGEKCDAPRERCICRNRIYTSDYN